MGDSRKSFGVMGTFNLTKPIEEVLRKLRTNSFNKRRVLFEKTKKETVCCDVGCSVSTNVICEMCNKAVCKFHMKDWCLPTIICFVGIVF